MNLIGQFLWLVPWVVRVTGGGALFRSDFTSKFWKFLSAEGPIVKFLFSLGLSFLIFCSGAIKMMFRVSFSASKMRCCFHSG